MLTVQFSPCRFVEHPDAQEFDGRVGRWMLLREAENSYILGQMKDILRDAKRGAGTRARLFSLEDEGAVSAAAVLFPDGLLAMTWATGPMLQVLAQGLMAAGCQIRTIFAPAHVSWPLAALWAKQTGQRWEMGPEERVYQLVRLRCEPPPTGHLELATRDDRVRLLPWMNGFIRETHYPDLRAGFLLDALIAQRQLFLWMEPAAVAMAAWVMPTPHGGCISFVYTPGELRGRGFGKAVVTALAKTALEGGAQMCCIYTGTTDPLTNSLYQKIGARTLCEFMRCSIVPAARRETPMAPVGQRVGVGA